MKDEYVFTPEQALEGLLDSNAGRHIFRHTHHQGGFSYANAGNHLEMLNLRPRSSESFLPWRLDEGSRYLLNPDRSDRRATATPERDSRSPIWKHNVVEFWRFLTISPPCNRACAPRACRRRSCSGLASAASRANLSLHKIWRANRRRVLLWIVHEQPQSNPGEPQPDADLSASSAGCHRGCRNRAGRFYLWPGRQSPSRGGAQEVHPPFRP